MKLTPWLVLLSLTAVSCSGSKSAQKVESDTPQIELSDADEFIENPSEDVAGTDADALAASEAPLEEPATEAVAESTPEETPADQVVTSSEPLVPESTLENGPTLESANAAPVVTPTYSDAGSIKHYTVQKNETLMMIAFKLYGDYGKWKEIANLNGETLRGTTALRTGMNLKYTAPAEEFVWNPQGNPYLIRTGDTLGGISKQVYADIKKWKLLWDNNRPLIKDPNKIYAGFTIYYLENGREVANQF